MPVFYASYAIGSRQRVRTIVTVGTASRYGVSSYVSDILSIPPMVSGKGKAVPVQAWSGPGGSRKLRFPDFITTDQGGGEIVSLTHHPPLPPGNSPGTHFC